MTTKVRRATLSPHATLKTYALDRNIFILGTLSTGVTIYGQQVRALNLAWAMTESLDKRFLNDIAVIGGGFAGVTFAAAMAKKGVHQISLFEKRSVLFPLQQGSDTRWIHPHIYDWPAPDSELPSAGLPVINWNAGRASDAVVQAQKAWGSVLETGKVRQMLDSKYIRIEPQRTLRWVSSLQGLEGGGLTKKFSAIVVALGFGEEDVSPGTVSYWRNESLGQPELTPGTRKYLISGFGDGALIDLFRIRIEQFRQDRILQELFLGEDRVVQELQKLKEQDVGPQALYAALGELLGSPSGRHKVLYDRVRKRLRHDTQAILHVRGKSFDIVYGNKSSFQNRVLMHLLFSVGGFIPSHSNPEDLVREYGIEPHNILLRHGTNKLRAVGELFSPLLLERLQPRLVRLGQRNQSAKVLWSGGYWDQPSPKLHKAALDKDKVNWRKEYLPPATELIAATFCSSIAALIYRSGESADFRTTIHRVIHVGNAVLLQQACEYFGTASRSGSKGRTFGIDQGIIGLAHSKKLVCRTQPRKRPFSADAVQRDAAVLRVGKDAQKLKSEVRSVLAIPLIAKDRVCMVVFADASRSDTFSDDLVHDMVVVASAFLDFVSRAEFPEIRNYPTSRRLRCNDLFADVHLETMEVTDARKFAPPKVAEHYLMNFETASERVTAAETFDGVGYGRLGQSRRRKQ